MSRRKLAWSAERRHIKADRVAPTKLNLIWSTGRDDLGGTIHFGRDENGTLQGTAFVVSVGGSHKIVAKAFTPGTLDMVRLGEWPMTPIGMRQAQAAVEAASVRQAA